MNKQNWQELLFTLVACLLLFTPTHLTVPLFGDKPESESLPTRFGQLFQVGEAVLLRPSTDHPVYSVQLLTRDQAEQLETTYAKYTEMQARRGEIDEQLLTETNINTRATLFSNRQELTSTISNISSTARLRTYAYEIAHVGEDFVTFQKKDSQKYIPLRSIRDVVRSRPLSQPRNLPPRLGRRSSDGSTDQRTIQVRLKYVPAAKVAELVNKFHPDPTRDLVIDEATNFLRITADAAGIRRLQEFIDVLDGDVQKKKPSDERKP